MRRTVGLALASLTLVSACGGDSDEPAASPSSASAPASSAAAPSTASSGSASSGSGTANRLTGAVGTTDDPDAFEIALVDGSGQPVTSLPAGQYQIQISDLSKIHNFHLSGGTVDESTTVPEVTEATFDVTLEPGDYTFECDPHPSMTGEFSVT